jgi:CubicO group peptidase (beta-lactamase class C family)
MVADGAPGAPAEFRDGGGAHRLSRGVAELGTTRRVDPAGWFRIGSVTKTYTAIVVLQLVGEGRLGLDDTAERWLPGTVPGGADITLRHLLTHTSGLHNYTDDLTADGILRDRHRRWTPEDVVARAVEHPPLFAPGTSRAYNNTGALGLARYRLPDGTTVWGKDGGFHGYQAWSYHSPDATCQLTLSATSAFNTRPTTPDLLASVAAAFTPTAR